MLLASPMLKNELGFEQFIDFLRSTFPKHFNAVQHIQFQYINDPKEQSGTLTFAICYTFPDRIARRALYDEGKFITDRTGWYPLGRGRGWRLYRLSDPKGWKRESKPTKKLRDRKFVSLNRLINITSEKPGCSLLQDFDRTLTLSI